MCELTARGRRRANEVADALGDAMPAAAFWADHGFEVVGRGESRIAVVPATDGLVRDGPCVLKFELGDRDQNRAEIANWRAAPPEVRDVLAPVADHAEDATWLVMPRAPEFGTPVDLVRIESVLEAAGWSCRGLHPENIGRFDDGPKAIDYGFPCIVDGRRVKRLHNPHPPDEPPEEPDVSDLPTAAWGLTFGDPDRRRSDDFGRNEFFARVADRLGARVDDLPGPARSVLERAERAVGEECRAMPGVIFDVVHRWGRDPCAINMGECAIFADAVADRVPDAVIVDNVEWVAQAPFDVAAEHAFLECGGRFYDSETPHGVEDWRDLPFFERNFAPADLEEAFIAYPEGGQAQVAEAGVWVPEGQ